MIRWRARVHQQCDSTLLVTCHTKRGNSGTRRSPAVLPGRESRGGRSQWAPRLEDVLPPAACDGAPGCLSLGVARAVPDRRVKTCGDRAGHTASLHRPSAPVAPGGGPWRRYAVLARQARGPWSSGVARWAGSDGSCRCGPAGGGLYRKHGSPGRVPGTLANRSAHRIGTSPKSPRHSTTSTTAAPTGPFTGAGTHATGRSSHQGRLHPAAQGLPERAARTIPDRKCQSRAARSVAGALRDEAASS